jgi:glucose-1-phosphate thymidylyltransferase
MESLILCAGFAKRLEPITEFTPKPLLYVKDKPLLGHIIDAVDDLKIKRKVISVNKKFSSQFKYLLNLEKAGGEKGIELVVEPSIDNAERYGAIGSINYAIRNAKIKDDLLIIAGDNYFEFDLLELKKHFEKKKKPIIALYDVKSIEDAKLFGVVSVDNESRIVSFTEKPEKPKSTLISTGIYIFPKGMLKKFHSYLKESGKHDEIGHFIEWLVKNEEVYGYIYKEGNWHDIGNLTIYRKLFYSNL